MKGLETVISFEFVPLASDGSFGLAPCSARKSGSPLTVVVPCSTGPNATNFTFFRVVHTFEIDTSKPPKNFQEETLSKSNWVSNSVSFACRIVCN